MDNIMMILVTFPSGGLYLSGFSDAQRKSVRRRWTVFQNAPRKPRLGLRFVIRNESEGKPASCFDSQICRIAESVFGCNYAPPVVFLHGDKSVGGINMKSQIFLVDDYWAVFSLDDNPA